MGKKIHYPKPQTHQSLNIRKLLAVLFLFISAGLLVIFTNLSSNAVIQTTSIAPSPHPLPPTLAQWQDDTNSGDYFSQVEKTQVGYLVWSQFPIKVYIERPQVASHTQAQAWFNSVLETVQEWSVYLPLVVVEQPDIADINILRKSPPLQFSRGGNFPRARSAQATYELYNSNINNNIILSHRFTILLSPTQTGVFLKAASRHELGHALGIWGHSDLPTDALYFSQVRNPPQISPRDVNTLKRIYEQPTSLGWSVNKFL
ncbi:peptidase [Nodularia sp. UHCC 0506]|uniref:peptidase n=1 Tax=Nodularia sp. UHCC 0506 TaxID=3110243 RepID=UPI002B1FE80A|nr:peptidase [Nodularia sp. UHCC 0506]MEA5516517.1 peptidase [Nodularia sp. UHCC 0506]